jgi:putative ATP-dependent endonuclease of OLD family
LRLDHEGKPEKSGSNNVYEYLKNDKDNVAAQSLIKKKSIEEDFNNQFTCVFVTEQWTLEYSLLVSNSLGDNVKTVLNNMYPKIDRTEYERELSKKLIGKDIKKTEFSYQLANLIDPESNDYDPSIKLDIKDQPIASLLKAVIYVCN